MAKLIVKNINTIISGSLEKGVLQGDSILCVDGVIEKIGFGIEDPDADIIIDACETTAIPGLIDSHCHTVLGDYTPRQKQVDFLDSYVHGGITSVVSAGEGVHAPGRPKDPVASKALAVAAFKCWENFHPNGMKINGGSIVLEPGLKENDFEEMAKIGLRYAKFGFGGYHTPLEGVPEVRNAQKYGFIVMAHSGGTSIPGSSPINHETLLKLNIDVCGHFNGGTTSLDDDGIVRVISESNMGLQIVQAGNLRSALHILKTADNLGCLKRVCIGSDTPTGTGVMPLAILKTVCELSSLGELAPESAIALATGNNAALFKLNTGKIETGWPADIVICDAPAGSNADNATDAIARGDIPGISCVIINGQVHVGRSRNTPLAKRLAYAKKGKIPGTDSH